MEFQNVGKHCDESTCRQKDFLPFLCRFCNKTVTRDINAFTEFSSFVLTIEM